MPNHQQVEDSGSALHQSEIRISYKNAGVCCFLTRKMSVKDRVVNLEVQQAFRDTITKKGNGTTKKKLGAILLSATERKQDSPYQSPNLGP